MHCDRSVTAWHERSGTQSAVAKGAADGSVYFVTPNRGAMHMAPIGFVIVVTDGVVHQGAIVPKDDVIRFPGVSIHKLRPRGVSFKKVKNGHALGVRHADDPRGEARAQEQALAAGFRVGSNHRLDDRPAASLLVVPS